MKAVVLCAGEGTRVQPLTFARPKHLMPVAGRAVLDHVLEALAEAGIEGAVFVVGRQRYGARELRSRGSGSSSTSAMTCWATVLQSSSPASRIRTCRGA